MTMPKVWNIGINWNYIFFFVIVMKYVYNRMNQPSLLFTHIIAKWMHSVTTFYIQKITSNISFNIMMIFFHFLSLSISLCLSLSFCCFCFLNHHAYWNGSIAALTYSIAYSENNYMYVACTLSVSLALSLHFCWYPVLQI